jgi:hypothetical protein
MIAIHQKVALAATAFVALGMFAAPAPAGQPGSINGKIRLAASLIPTDPCRHFRVVARTAAAPHTIVGKSGKMTRNVSAGIVECAYSIQSLSPDALIVIPRVKGVTGTFGPKFRKVTLVRLMSTTSTASRVDFGFRGATPTLPPKHPIIISTNPPGGGNSHT